MAAEIQAASRVEAARQSRPEKDAALLSRLLVGCSCMRAMHQIEALAGVGAEGLAVHTSGGIVTCMYLCKEGYLCPSTMYMYFGC